MNLWLFHEINGWSDTWAPFWVFFTEAANKTWFKIFAACLIVGMLSAKKQPRATIIQVLIALALANFSTDCFKHLLPEHRPFQELSVYIMRAGKANSMGTASAHAANMAAVAFVFTRRLKWWGTPWIAVAILTGISRVYVGVHYPYQVLLGWICGIVAGLLVTMAWDRIASSRKIVESREGEATVGEVNP
ncbi:MAG TPA: phosphatase PAP2 family protein [Fimbriimonas sp.]|nr:phosphatase PAP2 family protein [Fimbriimonas sp.]